MFCVVVNASSIILKIYFFFIYRPFCMVNAAKSGKNIFSGAVKEVKNNEDWTSFRTSLQVVTAVNLQRCLEPFEREVIWFPRVCEICKDSDRTKLSECSVCHSVFYCSKEHLFQDIDQHAFWCGSYRLCSYIHNFERERGSSEVPFPINIMNCYKPLPQDMLCLLNSELNFLKHAIQKEEEKDCNMDMLHFEHAKNVFNILISERMTDPLTLLNVLQEYWIGDKTQRICDVTELTIHVVGAESTREMMGLNRWEYLAHRLPSLKMLHIAFIGPSVLSNNSETVTVQHMIDNGQAFLCEECQKSDKKFSFEMYHMLYHRCAMEETFFKPDVVIAYNCGFHEFYGLENDTWLESLDLMLSDPSIPVIFTSYTKTEAQKDLQVIRSKKDATVSIPTRLNSFKSLKPVRDFHRDDNCPIFYINQYVTCVNGNKIDSNVLK